MKRGSIMKGKIFAVVFGIMALMCISVNADGLVLFSCSDAKMLVNGKYIATAGVPVNYGGNVYLPVDDLLKNTGFTVGWDQKSASVIAYKDGIYSFINVDYDKVRSNGIEKNIGIPTKVFNGVFYMPLPMYNSISDVEVVLDGTPGLYRDLLQDTVVYDTYRAPSAELYGNIGICGDRAMEFPVITDSATQNYASAVNYLANTLPDSVNVFCAVVPTASEFYAPAGFTASQTESIRKIYSLLNRRVIPINTVAPLMAHADEDIFFKTDHHWTQRGAFYVYREFAALRGFPLSSLYLFEKNDFPDYVGSLSKFAEGNGRNLIATFRENFERFVPFTKCKGESFGDMYMKLKYDDIMIINPFDFDYSCFVGGDCPISRFITGNGNGKKLCIIKDSYGNAFSTWAMEDYDEVYLVDPRGFNGFNDSLAKFNIRQFYDITHFDDLIIINYPISVGSPDITSSMWGMIN